MQLQNILSSLNHLSSLSYVIKLRIDRVCQARKKYNIVDLLSYRLTLRADIPVKMGYL